MNTTEAIQGEVHSAAIQLLNGLQSGDVRLQGAEGDAEGHYVIPLPAPRQWSSAGLRDFFAERNTTKVTIGREENGNVAVGVLAPDPKFSKVDTMGSHHLRERVVHLGQLSLGVRENTVSSGTVQIERGRLMDDTPFESEVAHDVSESKPLGAEDAADLLTVLTTLDSSGRAAERTSPQTASRMLGGLTARLALAQQ